MVGKQLERSMKGDNTRFSPCPCKTKLVRGNCDFYFVLDRSYDGDVVVNFERERLTRCLYFSDRL